MADAPIIRSKADYTLFVNNTLKAITFAVDFHTSCVLPLILLKRLNGSTCDGCSVYWHGICIANDSVFNLLK